MPKFLGGPNLRPTTDVLNAIWPITHNIGILLGTNRNLV